MRFPIILLAPWLALAAGPAERDLARACLKELIEINTTDSAGDNTRAAEAAARRLREAGFAAGDVQVIVPAPKKGNVVVRLRGSGKGQPVLLIAHLDVVEARREDWSLDPFTLTEKDGYFYGRGTQDNKGDAAIVLANFIRLKREGFVGGRDLILALTADEEGGRGPDGVEWLLANRRPLIDAAYCINLDSGGGQTRAGRRLFYGVQAAEKGYATFHLRATNPGGHSSLPVAQNAIYQLADALGRVRRVEFPVSVNAVTRSFFDNAAALESGQRAADMRAVAGTQPDAAAAARLSAASPLYNALLHTTCVATGLSGGHAENALPQSAEAAVNCRLMPGDTVEHVGGVLRQAVAGTGVEVAPPSRGIVNPASPWPPPFAPEARRALGAVWPGVQMLGVMETGGTDGRLLRHAGIPTYGAASMFLDVDDIRAHGRDERIPVAAFYEGVDFNYALLRAVAGL